jgi:hypothetical protein
MSHRGDQILSASVYANLRARAADGDFFRRAEAAYHEVGQDLRAQLQDAIDAHEAVKAEMAEFLRERIEANREGNAR